MRTRDQIVEPIRWDILVWVLHYNPGFSPTMLEAGPLKPEGGTWERHASAHTLPSDNTGALYPESVDDLQIIYPNATQADLLEVMRQLTGLQPPVMPDQQMVPWQALWKRIRSMPMTHGRSVGRIPVFADLKNKTHARRQDPDKMPVWSGRARNGSVPDSPRGTQRFAVLWVPNHIQAMDLKFQSLPAGAKVVMSALVGYVRERQQQHLPDANVIARMDVARVLETSDLVDKGWPTFTRYRSFLMRLGFIGEAK